MNKANFGKQFIKFELNQKCNNDLQLKTNFIKNKVNVYKFEFMHVINE